MDADIAGETSWRRSVSGAVVMTGQSVLRRATSTRQHVATLSISEAEYEAVAHGSKAATFAKTVLEFLQPRAAGRSVPVYEDKRVRLSLPKLPLVQEGLSKYMQGIM